MPADSEEVRRRAGRPYSRLVGLAFLMVIGFATANLLNTNRIGVLGLTQQSQDWPLPEFALPEARGPLVGDANVAQDNCRTGRIPCSASQRRKPACLVRGPGILTICDWFVRPLVISFWFTRGGDCESQQDVVDRVAGRYRGRAGFLSIDVRDSRNTVRQLIRKHGWRLPVGIDRDGGVSDIYQVGGCPTFAYAYPGGILESASVGRLDDAGLSRDVDALLAASARRARTSR